MYPQQYLDIDKRIAKENNMKTLIIFLILVSTGISYAQYEPHAIWSREGAGDSSLYGSSILALGDQNDDGFNDWAVYAHGWGGPGGINEPKVEFFRGGTPPETVPYMVRVTQPPQEEYLWGARSLGDLNGDGYTDWAILVELTDDSLGRDIYKIYFGGPGLHEEPDLILTAPWFSGYYGIGDFNGDQFDDLMLLDGENDRTRILFGGNPMDTISDWSKNTSLGWASHGNLNGDIFSDFVSYEDQSHIDLYIGNAIPDTVSLYHWPITTSWRYIVRDLNDDGFDELCYSRPNRMNVHWGSQTMQQEPSTALNFLCSGGLRRMAGGGDFNGDGFFDAVTLSEWCETSYGGILAMHLGGWWINPEPAFVVYGWTEPLNLIHFQTAAFLGDIDGDRLDDLAIGACGGIEYVAQRGKAVILAGDTSLHVAVGAERPELPNELTISIYPNPFNSECTISLALPAYRDQIELSLYNVLGQEVRSTTLRNVFGLTTHSLNAGDLPTGLYFLQVTSGNLQATTKLMLLR